MKTPLSLRTCCSQPKHLWSLSAMWLEWRVGTVWVLIVVGSAAAFFCLQSVLCFHSKSAFTLGSTVTSFGLLLFFKDARQDCCISYCKWAERNEWIKSIKLVEKKGDPGSGFMCNKLPTMFQLSNSSVQFLFNAYILNILSQSKSHSHSVKRIKHESTDTMHTWVFRLRQVKMSLTVELWGH